MKKNKLAHIISGLAIATSGEIAFAQANTLEEVIVTATKREESLQEIPIAVSAISGESFKQAGLDNNKDLAVKSPNLNISSPFSAANPYITLRGVGNGGDFSPLPEGSVGVAFDGVTVIAQNGRLTQAFDLERVEVLRGPQGTLFGKNTTGGVISYISRKPGDEFDYNIDLTVGRFAQTDVEFGMDMPVSDELKVRVAGVSNKRDGYVDNLLTKEDLNDVDNQAARVVMVWEPSDTFDATLNLNTFRDRGGVNTGKNRPVGVEFGGTGTDYLGFDGFAIDDPFTVEINTDTYEHIDSDGSILTMNWDLGYATLTSVSGVVEVDRDQVQDFDYSINDSVEHRYIDNTEQFSQELRLASNTDSDLQWMLGLFYFDSTLETNHRFSFAAISTFFHQNAKLDTESQAIFGNISYNLSDALRLRVEGRYTDETKDYRFEQLGFPGATAPDYSRADSITGPTVVNQPSISDDATFDEWSGRITLDYQMNDEVMLYASASRGFKSGIFQFPLFLTNTATNATGPETIVAYEVGAKTTLFDNRARINFSAFNYNFEDQQVFTLSGINPLVPELLTENADEVEIIGMELDFTLIPTANWTITGSVGYLPIAEYEEFTYLEGLPNAADLSGERIQYAPRTDGTIEVSHLSEFGNGMQLTSSVSYDFQAEHSADAANAVTGGRLYVPRWHTWNARFSLDVSEQLTVTAWAKNITDEEYIDGLVNIGAFGYDMALYGEPRTFGLTLSFKH